MQILEDIEPNLDLAQYGNQKGTGTDHMLISLVDKILSHLDNNLGSSGVLATMLNWSAAFDRQFTRSTSNFSTRLKLNSSNLQRVESMKLLGVWITENLDWETNTREICKKSYARLSLLCKLKFIGMNLKDLVCIAYIRNIYVVHS